MRISEESFLDSLSEIIYLYEIKLLEAIINW